MPHMLRSAGTATRAVALGVTLGLGAAALTGAAFVAPASAQGYGQVDVSFFYDCLLYTSPSPRD